MVIWSERVWAGDEVITIPIQIHVRFAVIAKIQQTIIAADKKETNKARITQQP